MNSALRLRGEDTTDGEGNDLWVYVGTILLEPLQASLTIQCTVFSPHISKCLMIRLPSSHLDLMEEIIHMYSSFLNYFFLIKTQITRR